jgi:hypothetical protein
VNVVVETGFLVESTWAFTDWIAKIPIQTVEIFFNIAMGFMINK